MTDYGRILELIKASEVRVATVSKEIKDVEMEIKTLDGEIEMLLSKENQLKDELSYKRKIVNEKEWELQDLNRTYETWKAMLEEKENIFEAKNEELGLKQQNVWDTRINFYNKTMDFLDKNDYLSNWDEFQRIFMTQREKKKLNDSIKELEINIDSLEKNHGNLKERQEVLDQLEMEKESLSDYEQSSEILRLQANIDFFTKDLQYLELELAKYGERSTVHRNKVLQPQKSECYDEARDSTIFNKNVMESKEMKDQNQETDFDDSRKNLPFKPKYPSFLLATKPSNMNKM